MSKGFVVFAQNTKTVDYVKQAYALALSIKYSQKTVSNISIVTNDKIPKKYRHAFDQVISIPWFDKKGNDRYATEHRWKLFHATPYDETIVLDTDMLLLEDISVWWEYCSNHDMRFCNRIKNYKLDIVSDPTSRRTFIANKLTSPYFALHYFKKSDYALEFYKTLEFVCKNWEWCWTKFAPEEYQDGCSMDLATAVTIEIMLAHDKVLDNLSPLEFIHMRSAIQGWEYAQSSWRNTVNYVLNSKGDFVVGNIKQSKLFHYIEKEFLTDDIIVRLEELING